MVVACAMQSANCTVVVGSGDWGGDTGKIQVFALDVEQGHLQLLQQLPAGGVAAYMAYSGDGRFLYVADETKGNLTSYRVDPSNQQLAFLNQVATQGRPVYVAMHRSARYLTTCFFEEAKTEVFEVREDGSLGQSVCCLDTGKESHCTVFDASHQFLFVPTRGANWLGQYRFDGSTGEITPNNPVRLEELEGAGPRHIVFHPAGEVAFLLNELSLTISVYSFDKVSGTFSVLQREVLSAPAEQSGGAAADIHVHPNGRYLYTSNRQGDASTLGIFEINAETRKLTLVGHELTRGRTPRNFAVNAEGTILIVGNRESQNVSMFRIEQEGAKLHFLGSQSVAPGPFYVGFGH